MTRLFSSFYDDMEDDEDDDDEDDDMIEMDDASVANFRSKMNSMFGAQDSSASTPSAFFEQDLDDDDEDDDIDDDDSITSSGSVEELIRFARNQAAQDEDPPNEDWATPAQKIKPGTVLVANPAKFCQDFVEGGTTMGVTPDPRLLAKFGLTLPPPADLGADRRADLLPVLIVVEHDTDQNNDNNDSDKSKEKDGSSKSSSSNAFNSFLSSLGGGNNKNSATVAVLLNRRTGYLLGDLEPAPGGMPDNGMGAASAPSPLLEKFCIQPLWFGGVDNLSPGLDMLHQCPTVIGATQLTDDGLFWGGEPTQAQDAMEDPSLPRIMTGFDFKFFVQATRFTRAELEQQLDDKVWFSATVSKQVLFKSRDRMGTQRAKPLWTEIMELMGGECREVRDQLYKEDDGGKPKS